MVNPMVMFSMAETQKNPSINAGSAVSRAGTVRELTVQPQNIDRLVAAMYREMDL